MAVPPSRSELMSRIRGRHTAPERILRAALWRAGLRYRLHARTPCGRPDVVFPGPKVAVFIDGCFWHGCPEHYVRPRSNEAFWSRKLRENVDRDRRQTLELEAQGWRAIRVWEHQVFEELPAVLRRVEAAVRGEPQQGETSWRVTSAVAIDDAGTMERRILEDLRDGSIVRIVEQARVTAKWRPPKELPRLAAEPAHPYWARSDRKGKPSGR